MKLKTFTENATRSTARYAAIGALVFAGVFASARTGGAQLPIPTIGIVGGVSHYSLATTGTAPFAALRLELPLATLLAEGSLGVFRPDEQTVQRTYIIPEAQLQWQIFPVIVRPYVGVGLGWFRAVSGPSPAPNDVT
jgi:hypothetical protein